MSELPFLKNKNKNQGGGGPVERKPDSFSGDHLLGLISEEFLSALEKKDRQGLIQSLRAFVLHVKDEDQNG